jgi:hypothetical protein
MGFFGFGKKKRSTRRKTVSKKPPSRLLRICKKYRVKATRRVGSKRVYKSIKVLKKLCLKKARALQKKLMKSKKKGVKKSRKTTRRRGRKSRFGMDEEEEERMGFGRRRSGFGYGFTFGGLTAREMARMQRDADDLAGLSRDQILDREHERKMNMLQTRTPSTPVLSDYQIRVNAEMKAKREANRARLAAGKGYVPTKGPQWSHVAFGKRRRGAKTSRKTAMKAFSSFYKRHCAGRRGSRFGSGGNPPLNMSMGYEFCPSGMGGVLGANSTGLFPSPCIGTGGYGAVNTTGNVMDAFKARSSSFGARRRRCRRAPAKRTINSKSPCNKLKKKDCKTTPGCGYVSGRKRYGCKRKPIYARRSGFGMYDMMY